MPNQAVREPKSVGVPGAGDFFALVEVRGANLEKAEQKLAELIRDSYYLGRGSITSACAAMPPP
jgi:hypothetical protein